MLFFLFLLTHSLYGAAQEAHHEHKTAIQLTQQDVAIQVYDWQDTLILAPHTQPSVSNSLAEQRINPRLSERNKLKLALIGFGTTVLSSVVTGIIVWRGGCG